MLAAAALAGLLVGCGGTPHPPALARAELRVHRAAPPTEREPWCAWFGDVGARETLYFGISAFWGTFRESGDPTADLREAGPRWIGRFDLAEERLLPPLRVGPARSPGGVWDVLVHPDGSVWFTTFFGRAGRVEPGTGRVQWLEEAGDALAELALGPGGRVLASRYASRPDGTGEVRVLSRAGALERVLPLPPPEGAAVAAKSVAFDPLRREVWVNTDLLGPDGSALGHDARVLSLEGEERLRFARPELLFVIFEADGTGWLAERDGPRLRLRMRPPARAGSALPLPAGRILALDDAFPPDDFVQELRPAPGGSVLVTRWSGIVHRAWPDGRVDDLVLPRAPEGLYYTAVLRDDGRLCATRCERVEVVCRDAEG